MCNTENKVCKTCNTIKSVTEFNKRTINNKHRYQHKCKMCFKSYRLEHKIKIQEYKEFYKVFNVEKIKTSNHKTYLKNKNKWKNQRIRYALQRRKNNQLIRFIDIIRHRIYMGITNNKQRSHVLLGCDYHYAKNHIEKQFKADMTWENHGKIWHIDHIIPISYFDMSNTTEQILAFHWGNLQPLYVKENLEKSDKILNLNFIY